MAVSLSDTFESQYFIQDKEGNVWGEIKPIDISMTQTSSEYPEIELSGYLSAEWWKEHCKESWVISENDKGGNEMEILEIWKSRKVAEIHREMEEAKKEINKRDEIVERVKELEATLTEEYSMFTKITLETDSLTQESEEKLEEIERNHKTKHCKIIDKVDEIKAQLEICENYEQKMNILIAYGIIDKKTKQILA